jgi:hypothetical protein
MFQVKMRYAGISEPYKLTRVYERDNKTKKTKSLQERFPMISQSYNGKTDRSDVDLAFKLFRIRI